MTTLTANQEFLSILELRRANQLLTEALDAILRISQAPRHRASTEQLIARIAQSALEKARGAQAA